MLDLEFVFINLSQNAVEAQDDSDEVYIERRVWRDSCNNEEAVMDIGGWRIKRTYSNHFLELLFLINHFSGAAGHSVVYIKANAGRIYRE